MGRGDDEVEHEGEEGRQARVRLPLPGNEPSYLTARARARH